MIQKIYIRREQLLYDIDSETYLVEQSRKRGDDRLDFISTDEKKHDALSRWIDKYVENAKSRMSAFLVTRESLSQSDELQDWAENLIVLDMPSYWDETTFSALVKSVHSYIVNGVCTEYYSLILGPNDPLSIQKREDSSRDYSDIKQYVCSFKRGTIRKRLHPF